MNNFIKESVYRIAFREDNYEVTRYLVATDIDEVYKHLNNLKIVANCAKGEVKSIEKCNFALYRPITKTVTINV